MVNLTENINGIIKKRGYTQDYIASKLNITQGNLSQKIGQNHSIKYSTLYEIANIIGVEVIDIITFPEPYVPESSTRKECERCKELDRALKNLNDYIEILKQNKK